MVTKYISCSSDTYLTETFLTARNLYPTIGMWSKGAVVEANFDKKNLRFQGRLVSSIDLYLANSQEKCNIIHILISGVKPFLVGGKMTDIAVKKGLPLFWHVKYGGEPQPEVKWFFGPDEYNCNEQSSRSS